MNANDLFTATKDYLRNIKIQFPIRLAAIPPPVVKTIIVIDCSGAAPGERHLNHLRYIRTKLHLATYTFYLQPDLLNKRLALLQTVAVTSVSGFAWFKIRSLYLRA